jgi:hypothetical protein
MTDATDDRRMELEIMIRLIHCRVRETVQIYRDTVLPSKMEECKQQEGTCHFISIYLYKSV